MFLLHIEHPKKNSKHIEGQPCHKYCIGACPHILVDWKPVVRDDTGNQENIAVDKHKDKLLFLALIRTKEVTRENAEKLVPIAGRVLKRPSGSNPGTGA